MNSIKIKSVFKGFPDLLRRLICVPKCASCRTRLGLFVDADEFNHGIPCFCEKCLGAWGKTRVKMCRTCGNVAGKCTCMPIKNTFMQPYIPSLFFYHTDETDAPARAIYTLKHTKHIDLYRFVTTELAVELSALLDELEIQASDCIFTHIPRTKKGIRKNGFDQGELLAKYLCTEMDGYAALPLLVRCGGKEQKKLSSTQRRKNAEASFQINSEMKGINQKDASSMGELISGKTVILTDDVITSGSSMSQGIKVLRRSGAKIVICASIARCELSVKNKKGKNST